MIALVWERAIGEHCVLPIHRGVRECQNESRSETGATEAGDTRTTAECLVLSEHLRLFITRVTHADNQ